MARQPIATWYFVLVVVEYQGKYLLVHETKHGQNWYLPAGRVEAGEDFIAAAKRETLEESGVLIELDGILRIEHSPLPNSVARFRVIFTAHPVGDIKLKTIPDKDSLEAKWFSLPELDSIALRGEEVKTILNYAASKKQIYPIDLIAFEGAPYN